MFNLIFLADDWIRTADLWIWKRKLYQLSHNHCRFDLKRTTLLGTFVHTSKRKSLITNATDILLRLYLPTCCIHYSLLLYLKWTNWVVANSKKDFKKRCRHSSVDSSAPAILRPVGQIPSTPSMLFPFVVKFCTIVSIALKWPKINREACLGPNKKQKEQ